MGTGFGTFKSNAAQHRFSNEDNFDDYSDDDYGNELHDEDMYE